MIQDKEVHILLTGGTISKTYDPATEKPEMDAAPTIRDYICDVIKPHRQITSQNICLKDSVDITDEDRADMATAIKSAEQSCILVVHGTSTMEITASYLAEALKTSDKAVVLTGAMIPLKEFAMSDGGFNLGYALAQVQKLDPGVYICMNAHTFPAGSVTKDVQAARFIEKI